MSKPKKQVVFQTSLFEPTPLLVQAQAIKAKSLSHALLYLVFKNAPMPISPADVPPQLREWLQTGYAYILNNLEVLRGSGEPWQWCLTGNGFRALRDAGFQDVPTWCCERRGWYND